MHRASSACYCVLLCRYNEKKTKYLYIGSSNDGDHLLEDYSYKGIVIENGKKTIVK